MIFFKTADILKIEPKNFIFLVTGVTLKRGRQT